MIQFHILIYKQGFTIIPVKEGKPKLKHNMEPSDVTTRVQTRLRQPLRSRWPALFHCSEPLLLSGHLSPRKLLIFNYAKEFLQRGRCDSGFSLGFKDTSYSFYQSQNMVEIQHELSFLSISLETTRPDSYNAGTPSRATITRTGPT